jgi:hypothetical protein
MEKRRCHWRFDGQITSGLGVTMGQSKAKRKSQAALLASRPGCIYCAGAAIATTIEHMPPISLFEGRQRPKGLEFPACEACNNGTGHSDLVAAMLARTWPDAKSETQRKDVTKIFRAIENNIPGILHEMNPGRAAEKLARKRHNLSADVHPLQGTGCTAKRVSEALEWRGESGQLGFAVESHRGTAVERWRRVDQHRKGCKPVPFGSLKGGTDEGVSDQG